MRKRSALALALAAIVSLHVQKVRAAIPIEQIEPYEDPNSTPPADRSHYAAVDFGGSSTLAGSGVFTGITFHALDKVTDTFSSHANAVGQLMYGTGSFGHASVSDVYSAAADTFIPAVVNPQNATSNNGPVPGHFDGGSKVINNSYVDVENSNLDALRRWDFMIHRDDVTFIDGAVIDNSNPNLTNAYLDWSVYNSVAVWGAADPFVPTGSPGKAHADIYWPGLASFATADVSSFAAGLYGNAQAAGQVNAQHDVVMRSLLMSGADATIPGWARLTANNLNTAFGAGQASFPVSLAILQSGQKPIHSVLLGAVIGTPTTDSKGWSYDLVPAGGQSAVLFHTDNTINGITATLNWDVDQLQPLPGEIDTTDAGTVFPDLGLEVRSLTGSGGIYTLNASFSDPTLHSDAGALTSSPNDNIEHIYFTGTLPAGDYAFLMRGDSSLPAQVGFSYTLSEVPEPASSALIALAGLALLKRRRA